MCADELYLPIFRRLAITHSPINVINANDTNIATIKNVCIVLDNSDDVGEFV